MVQEMNMHLDIRINKKMNWENTIPLLQKHKLHEHEQDAKKTNNC